MRRRKAPAERSGDADWTGMDVARRRFRTGVTVFAQGDPASSVMYVEHGDIRLSVLSRTGKEAVVAVLRPGHFFGEGCLVGQPQRMGRPRP